MLGSVLTAIITPFKADGAIDYDAFADLCVWLVDNGSDGLVVAGTTGECPTLLDPERVELVRVAKAAVGDRASIVAGTGTNATADSIQITEMAHEAGADAFLVVTPYYNKPPQRGIVAHFAAVAACTDRPVIAYNIPGRVVVNVESATMTELAKIPNLTAVKQANDDIEQAKHIVSLGLDLYAGDDNLVQPFLEIGGKGGICVHTHVVGPQVASQVAAMRDGDLEAARAIDRELAPAYDLLKISTNPIAIKAAVELLGHRTGGFRLPLVPPTAEELSAVRGCLERLNLLGSA
ncbi:MAG: 4-hydroxy-tetrahydrodipicolinate synthase [Actinobacteria bacterium]|uniref:4-hydroxy-tetrahydrodipicolinate synthase n=1 Tax=freshwater metagenome TaxID=449393 RepID=A0A6J6Q933_9ZZZZ|nr:4-hydroxy-tetrahydrodipicolinate synthase [Actinomycetota bacterium]